MDVFEAGQLSIDSPWYEFSEFVEPGRYTFTIPINPVLSGTYILRVSLNGTSSTLPIIVSGYEVKFKKFDLDKQSYRPGEKPGYTIWMEANREVSGRLRLIYGLEVEDMPLDLHEGLNVLTGRLPFAVNYSGPLMAVFEAELASYVPLASFSTDVSVEEEVHRYTLTLETPHANAYGAGEYEEGMQAEFWVEPTQITQGHYTYVAYGYLLDGVFHEGTHGTVTMNADHHVEFLWRTYVDEVELQLLRRRDRPMRRLWLTLEFEDGTQITARTDRQGRIRLEDVPLGKVEMGFTYRRIPYRISFYLEDYGEQQVKLNIGRGYLRVRPERMRARIGIWFNGTGFTLFFMDGSSMYWPIIEQHEDRRYTYYTVQTEWGELTIKARRNYLFYGRTHELYFRARLI